MAGARRSKLARKSGKGSKGTRILIVEARV